MLAARMVRGGSKDLTIKLLGLCEAADTVLHALPKTRLDRVFFVCSLVDCELTALRTIPQHPESVRSFHRRLLSLCIGEATSDKSARAAELSQKNGGEHPAVP